MDAIITRFWWAGDARRRTIHWCSIDKLANSKREGGLGFRSFSEFNLAFLAKLAWKLLYRQMLCGLESYELSISQMMSSSQ
ncbi:Uncharacterized mitochondrial protein AtMg00310 [Linum perenne]